MTKIHEMLVGGIAYAQFHSVVMTGDGKVWLKGIDPISYERSARFGMVIIRKTNGFIVQVRASARFEQHALDATDREILKLRPVMKVMT